MSRRKSVVRIEISEDLRRSPRFARQNEPRLLESVKNPNLKSASVPRRSPRIGNANKVQDPKTPDLESVRNQGRLARHKSVMSPPSRSSARVEEGGSVEVKKRKEVRKSFVSEPRRSPKVGEICNEKLVCSNSKAFKRKPGGEAKTDRGSECSGKESLGLRRSLRLLSQQRNYKDADQKLDEICGPDGGGSVRPVKSNSPVGSEEELSQMVEEASWKNGDKDDRVAKRKRKRGKEGSEVVRGWTKEQETALERAYMAMKPTPRFWKKVSKMVGKSAQECFDRIDYDQHTPVPPRIRSRLKMKTSPHLNGCPLSASKLLGSPKQVRKRKTQLGQKKVRELLQKQCNIENEYEGDLFSVLEGNMASSPRKVSQRSLGDRSNSFSARKKSISRLGNTAPLVSPPVLKQVKNKALHEKYIDQLHCREAKRKAELTRTKKTAFGKENSAPTSCNQQPDIVKAAKLALESDARDVILQFQQVQAKALNLNYNRPSQSEDDDIQLSSDENEDEL